MLFSLFGILSNWTYIFLNGDLHEDVDMFQPPDFVDQAHPFHDHKLQKALYGLNQSPQEWFLKLSNCLVKWKFTASKSGSSMFVYHENSVIVIILIYVDDILVVGNCLQCI